MFPFDVALVLRPDRATILKGKVSYLAREKMQLVGYIDLHFTY